MENNNNNPSSSRTDRKIIERNRRTYMKSLYSKLHSLVPHETSRESMSLLDQLDEATNYIKKLQINLERMREKKESLLGINNNNHGHQNQLPFNSSSGRSSMKHPLRLAQIDVNVMCDSTLEVVLVSGLNSQFVFNETVRILQEEGSEVVNATFSVVDGAVFHTIHSLIGDFAFNSNGVARISQRLKKFVHDANDAFFTV